MAQSRRRIKPRCPAKLGSSKCQLEPGHEERGQTWHLDQHGQKFQVVATSGNPLAAPLSAEEEKALSDFIGQYEAQPTRTTLKWTPCAIGEQPSPHAEPVRIRDVGSDQEGRTLYSIDCPSSLTRQELAAFAVWIASTFGKEGRSLMTDTPAGAYHYDGDPSDQQDQLLDLQAISDETLNAFHEVATRRRCELATAGQRYDQELRFEEALGIEWRRRHPGTLPPFLASQPPPPCFRMRGQS